MLVNNSWCNKTTEVFKTAVYVFVGFPMRENITLDQVYNNIPDANKATPLPPVGISDHLHMCYLTFVLGVSPQQTIKVFPNQNPWLNSEVHALLRAHDAAFKTGDQQAYKEAHQFLLRGIQ